MAKQARFRVEMRKCGLLAGQPSYSTPSPMAGAGARIYDPEGGEICFLGVGHASRGCGMANEIIGAAEDVLSRNGRTEIKVVRRSHPRSSPAAQLNQLAHTLATPPNNPVHHVVYSPGFKDRVRFTKSSHRGHLTRYWLDLNTEYALPVLKEYMRVNSISTEDHRVGFLGLKHLLYKDPNFLSFPESAPTRCPHLFKRRARALACAWLP